MKLRAASARPRRVLAAVLGAAFILQAALPARAEATLRVGSGAQPNTLNPLTATLQIESYLFTAIFSGLLSVDDRGRLIPDLAAAVPSRRNGGVSTDGKTIVYRLRPGMRWQDGVPLTADDVVFTFAKIRDPAGTFPARSRYDAVERVEARDPQTVVLHLRVPAPDALAQFFVSGQNGSIVPKHILANVPNMQTAAFNARPIGSGPYAVERWDRGSALLLRANPAYFGGAPSIPNISVRFYADGNTQAIALRTGELDLAYDVPPAALSVLRDDAKVRIERVPMDSVQWLIVNTAAMPTNDVRLREALALAVDRERIVANVYRGFAQPAGGLIPPWSPFSTADTGAMRFDLAQARALLDRAGWRAGDGGLRRRAGVPLAITLTTVAGSPQRQAMAVLLQSAWRALGVDVSVRSLPVNALVSPDGVLPRGDFTIALLGFAFPITPDRSNLLATSAIPMHGFNYPRYSNRQMDRLLVSAQTQRNGAARVQVFHNIAGVVSRDRPFVPIVWTTNACVVSKLLAGFRWGPDAGLFWNAASWRLARAN